MVVQRENVAPCFVGGFRTPIMVLYRDEKDYQLGAHTRGQ